MYVVQINVVQSLSHIQLFATPWSAAHQASLSFTISLSVLKLLSIELVMPSSHLILSPSSPSLSQQQDLYDIRWPKYWSFSISPPNEYSDFISFRIDWFDLLAVQGTLNSLQQHNLKASVIRHLAFFMVQLSLPYMTT